jgi:hypothetical protein
MDQILSVVHQTTGLQTLKPSTILKQVHKNSTVLTKVFKNFENTENYRPSRAVILFCITVSFLSCSSTALKITSVHVLQQDRALVEGSNKKGTAFFEVTSRGEVKTLKCIPEELQQENITLLGMHSNLLIGEGNRGLMLKDANSHAYLFLSRKEYGLPGDPVRNIFSMRKNGAVQLYITWRSPRGGGVTHCIVKNNVTSAQCNTINTAKTPLKSNRVHQVAVDSRGTIWFRYSPKDEAGVSRLKMDGSWQHFNRNNSDLGDSAVYKLKVEKKGEGLPGENIWFASRAGLCSLHYEKENETWKLYGDKHSFGDKVTNALGISQWFSDDMIDVIDLHILKDSLVVASKHALFHLRDDDVDRFVPETIGGLKELRIRKIHVRNDTIIALISPQRDARRNITSAMAFRMKDRTWHNLKHWDIAKAYPVTMEFYPLNNESDIVLCRYRGNGTAAAVFNYSDLTMRKLKFQ